MKLALIFVLLSCLTGSGTDYFMATNGNNSNAGTATNAPWLTLTKAGGAMHAGDTLYIRGGTYNCDPNTGTYQYFSPNNFTVNPSLGTQANPLVVTNYPGETPTFVNANLTGTGVCPFPLGYNSWIKIFGLTMSNCNMASIELGNSLTNCEIAYCTLGLSATNKRGSILTIGDNCYSNYVHHCKIFGSWSSEQVNAITGRQGESGDTVSFGISAWSGAGAETNSTCRYNVFATNTIYWGGHSAFNPIGARDCYFLGNTIHNEVWINWPDYHQLGGHRVVGAFAGWCLYDGNDFGYAGNPIANDGAEGIGIFGQYNIVRRNRIHHNENFGLTLYDKGVGAWHPNTNRIYQNTFAHNALGQMSQTNYYAPKKVHHPTNVVTDLSMSKCVVFMAGSTNNVFVNNIFAFNGGFIGTNGIEYRSGITNENTAFSRTNWFNNLTGDPKFLNDTNQLYFWGNLAGNPFGTNANEYSLASDSPCIDKGEWLTTAIGDASGTSLSVIDPWYFWAGTAAAGTIFPGDTIQLQGQTDRATITAIYYSAGVLILNSSLTWTNGQGVALSYTGAAPDLGAFEY